MSLYSVLDRALLQAGQPEDVSKVLENFDAIAAVLANLENVNIGPAAAIDYSKLALTGKLQLPADLKAIVAAPTQQAPVWDPVGNAWSLAPFPFHITPAPGLPVGNVGGGAYVANTLTTLQSVVIPAGTIGASGARAVKFYISGTMTNSTGGNRNFRLFVQWGPVPTTIYDSGFVGAVPTSANIRSWDLELLLFESTLGAALLVGKLCIGNATAPTVGQSSAGASSFLESKFRGLFAGAPNRAVDNTLTVQWAWDTGSANCVLGTDEVLIQAVGK